MRAAAVFFICGCLSAFAQGAPMTCNPPDSSCVSTENGACYVDTPCPAPDPTASCATNCGSCLAWEQNQATDNYNCCAGIAQCGYESAVNEACAEYNDQLSYCWEVFEDLGGYNGDPNATMMFMYCVMGDYTGYQSAVDGAQAARNGQWSGCSSSEQNSLGYANAAYEGCMNGCQ